MKKHYEKYGNEQMLLDKINENLRDNKPIEFPMELYHGSAHGIVLSTHQLKMPSEFLTDLFKPVPTELFRFYSVLENDVDEIWEESGAYLPTQKYIYMPGGTSPSIEHEVAHFLEMSNIKRLIYKDMGMTMDTKFHRLNSDYSFTHNEEYRRKFRHALQEEMQVAHDSKAYLAALIRELKVREIQKILLNTEIHKKTADHFYDLKYNHAWVPPEKNQLWDNRAQFDEWAINLANLTRRTWSEEKIRFEFDRRINYVREWQATQANHSPSIEQDTSVV